MGAPAEQFKREVYRHLSRLFGDVTLDPRWDLHTETAIHGGFDPKLDFKIITGTSSTIWVRMRYLGERKGLGEQVGEEARILRSLRNHEDWTTSDRIILITNVELPNEEKGGFRNSGIIPFVLGKNLHETKSALRETLGDLPELRP